MTFLGTRIVYGHTLTPRLVVDCRHAGAVLPVSMTMSEFIAACEQDGTSPSPVISGGDVLYSYSPSAMAGEDHPY